MLNCTLCRGAVAQLVERPSKVPVWCNSTDVGSNPSLLGKKVLGKNPSCAIYRRQATTLKCSELSSRIGNVEEKNYYSNLNIALFDKNVVQA